KKLSVNHRHLLPDDYWDDLTPSVSRINRQSGNEVLCYNNIGVLLIVPFHQKYQLLLDNINNLGDVLNRMCRTTENNLLTISPHDLSSSSKENKFYSIFKFESIEILNCFLMSDNQNYYIRVILQNFLLLVKQQTINDESIINVIETIMKHNLFIKQLLSDKKFESIINELGDKCGWKKIECQIFNAFQLSLKRSTSNIQSAAEFLISFVTTTSEKHEILFLKLCMINELLTVTINSLPKSEIMWKNVSRWRILSDLCPIIHLLSLFHTVYLSSLTFISSFLIKFIDKKYETTEIIDGVLQPTLISCLIKIWPIICKNSLIIPLWFQMLYNYCLNILNESCNQQLSIISPIWTRITTEINCECNNCKLLQNFFEDENANKQQFIMVNIQQRQHFNRTIDQLELPLTLIIEHNGDNENLWIKKNGSKIRKCEKYESLRQQLIDMNIKKLNELESLSIYNTSVPITKITTISNSNLNSLNSDLV
ncbi:unnamed protein product, partial [Didymodactylos carnosus]